MNNDNLAHDLQMQDDYETCNYPPEGDSESLLPSYHPLPPPGPRLTAPPAASEGAYSAPNTIIPHSTQPHPNKAPSEPDPGLSGGLIDQSPDGGPLSSSLQDAQQGSDPRAREAFAHAAQRDFDFNRVGGPYGRTPDSVGERGASAYADARGRQFESGPAGGDEEDVGAF